MALSYNNSMLKRSKLF